jgi:hypothetical protein
MPVQRTRRAWPALVGAALIALGILGLAAVALLIAHDRPHGDGVAATRVRQVPPFTGVELAGVGVVTIRSGTSRSVVVRCDDELLDDVTTRVEDGSLVIGLEEDVHPRRPPRIAVTLPALERLTLSGAGEMRVAGVRAQRLQVTLSGAGRVQAQGTADRLDVALPGVGTTELGGLRARTVRARVDGAGRIEVHPLRRLDASVAGTGEIVYRGSPADVRSSVTGAGVITPAAGPST